MLRRLLTTGSCLLLTSVAALTVPSTPATSSDFVEDYLALASTVDEPFLGGRQLTLTQDGADINMEDRFWASFRRTDDNDADLRFDPFWIVELDPSALSAGQTLSLDRTTTAFRLGKIDANTNGGRDQNAEVWFADVCPDMSGEASVTTLDYNEVYTNSVAISFTLECSPGDAIYGSFAYRTAPETLPPAADALIAADADFPRLTHDAERDPDEDQEVAVRPVGDDLLMRFEPVEGFACTSVSVYPRETVSYDTRYVGFEDTLRIPSLDPTQSYEYSVGFARTSDSTGCVGWTGDDYGIVHAVRVSLEQPPIVDVGSSTRLRGTVVARPYPETNGPWPLPLVKVQVWGRIDGVDTQLATTKTEGNGDFAVDVSAERSMPVWAVVPGGTGGFAGRIKHFGSSSDQQQVDVRHSVRAWLTDTTVPADRPFDVLARLKPADDTLPVRLERKNRDGEWVTAAQAVTTPDSVTSLTLPRVRRGWQALRVVAPGDGWHLRGVSDRLRLFGF